MSASPATSSAAAPPKVTGPGSTTETGLALSTTGFAYPIDHWDCHVYFLQTNPKQLEFAKSLYADISLKFPHLKLWPFHDNPHGPHTVGMFEVDVKNPLDFGTMVSFLALNRGPLSVLVHPHRRGPEAESEARPGRDIKDHTQYAFWMGERHHLDFEKMVPPTSAATTAMAQPAAL